MNSTKSKEQKTNSKKQILVTGGAGYIGSHTVRALKKAGFKVVIYDNLSSGHRDAVNDFELIEGDLADPKKLDEVFGDGKFDGVIHFAGLIEVGESMKDPGKFFQNNLVYGLNLLNAVKNHNVKNIVFSSSAAVYGNPVKVPIHEDDPKKPTNFYGLTKLMFEEVLEAYDYAYGLRYVALRYFNAAGADPTAEIGEDHDPETHLIPLVLQAASGKRPDIKIFGADYPTPDGTCVRDYVHVNDLAQAHVLALKYLFENGKSDKFNLGNGLGYSNREVVAAAKKVSGVDFKVEDVPRREGDPAKLVASSEKAKKVLGWKPEFPEIEEITKTAWRWHKSHPEGYKSVL